MPRDVGWGDETVGNRGPDKERQYRGVKGETHVIRVMTTCKEVRVHFVDDILEPDKDGEARGFWMNCSREWDESEEEWVGDCMGCDREYTVSSKFVAGILFLGIFKGRAKKPTRIDPESAVNFWDFGNDKYKQLRELHFELARDEDDPKKLHQVELTVKTKKQDFQDLTIAVYTGKRLTTKDYVDEFKAEGKKLIEAFCKTESIPEQKRNLKPRKPRRSRDDEDDEDDDERPTKPRKGKKKRRREEPEDDDHDEESTGDDDLDALIDEIG